MGRSDTPWRSAKPAQRAQSQLDQGAEERGAEASPHSADVAEGLVPDPLKSASFLTFFFLTFFAR